MAWYLGDLMNSIITGAMAFLLSATALVEFGLSSMASILISAVVSFIALVG